MIWEDVSDVFEIDGSLRDITVRETSASDWDRLILVSRQFGVVSYERNAQVEDVPTSAVELLEDTENNHCMRVNLGGPVANAHFFFENEIELDLDPREIQSQAAMDKVLRFCEALGQALQSNVLITGENSPDDVLLEFSVASQVWRRNEGPALSV